MKIFTHDGNIIENSKFQKLNLPKSFTLKKNGGLKTVFFNEKATFYDWSTRLLVLYYGWIETCDYFIREENGIVAVNSIAKDLEKH